MSADITYQGKPCKNCGSSLKYRSGRNCVACAYQRQAAWRVNNQAKDSARRRAYYQANKLRLKSHQLKSKYGITIEQYTFLCEQQKGKCSICETVAELLVVDHCHTTHAVRGLLCYKCNTGLGQFNDSSPLLEAALAYLNKTQTETDVQRGT